MKKVRKILLPILAAIFILVGIAMVVMYNMGDRIMEEAIKSALIAAEDTGTDTPADTENNTDQGSKNNQEKQNNTTGETPGTVPTDKTGTPAPSVNPGEAAQGGKAAGEPKATTGQTTSGKKTEPQNNKIEIPVEKINEIKDEISAADKITAAALVLKRLSASDINELKNMLSSGLSSEGKKKAMNIAYARFTPEEINQIKAMYEKYMK